MNLKPLIHTTRMILSFALLGAIIAGVFGGGVELDLRPYGAAIGAGASLLYQLLQAA